jgi:hypothetical protein
MLPKPRSSEVLSFTLTRRAVSDFLRGSRGARRLPTDGCLMRANGTLDPPGNRYGIWALWLFPRKRQPLPA